LAHHRTLRAQVVEVRVGVLDEGFVGEEVDGVEVAHSHPPTVCAETLSSHPADAERSPSMVRNAMSTFGMSKSCRTMADARVAHRGSLTSVALRTGSAGTWVTGTPVPGCADRCPRDRGGGRASGRAAG